MPSEPSPETRRTHTLRVIIIAAAIGSMFGAGIVIASVATVLSFVNPPVTEKVDKQAALQPPAKTLSPAEKLNPPPAVQAAVAPVNDPKAGCADRTWPNIESRCLTRIDSNAAPPAATPNSVPNAPASLPTGAPEPRNVTPTQANPATQPVAQPQTAAAPVASPPTKSSRHSRRAERHRRNAARYADDSNDRTSNDRRTTSRSQPDDQADTPAERSSQRRYHVRRRIETGDNIGRPSATFFEFADQSDDQ